jgi:DNA-binding protein HU-beta
MSDRITRKDLTDRVAKRLDIPQSEAAAAVNATFEELYEAIKEEKSVSLRNFGTFYVDASRGKKWVFKFNPSQRLRKLFGWSSTYKGDL